MIELKLPVDECEFEAMEEECRQLEDLPSCQRGFATTEEIQASEVVP